MEIPLVDKPEAYNHSEIFNNPYNAQNILLNQAKFPERAYYDETSATYEDRNMTAWDEACKWYRKHAAVMGYIDWPNMNKEDVIKFAEIFHASWLAHIKRPITGARIIRTTNVSNGYPCLVCEAYSHNGQHPMPELYDDIYNAPNLDKFYNIPLIDSKTKKKTKQLFRTSLTDIRKVKGWYEELEAEGYIKDERMTNCGFMMF